MGIKIVKEELEARLEPVSNSPSFSKSRGKIERKDYGDGNKRLKVSINNFDVPDGSDLELVINNKSLARIKVYRGKTSMDVKTEGGGLVPDIYPHDTACIYYGGEMILKGRFYPD